MTVHECRRCGVLLNVTSTPRQCPACKASSGIQGADTPVFRRINDVDELFA